MGKVLDGVAPHMAEHDENSTFLVSDEPENDKEEIIKILTDSGAKFS